MLLNSSNPSTLFGSRLSNQFLSEPLRVWQNILHHTGIGHSSYSAAAEKILRSPSSSRHSFDVSEQAKTYLGSLTWRTHQRSTLIFLLLKDSSERTSYFLPPAETGYSLPIEGTSYSLPLEGDSYSLPLEETSYSLPPKGASYSLPPKGTSCSLPLEGTSYSLPLEETSYSLVISSGPEVAFVTPALPVDHSNIEWFCLRNIRS
ncbi:hypothetical protein Tco_1055775 [Tanacetum coccineum]|uniref:Uncharacterized protein n=1 Tax=Tanacetum coccineum TaxID=301880 RepID=A0ABQ5H0L5_9ASTR